MLYVYRCPTDGEEKEVRHAMFENPSVVCASGHAMHRKPSLFRWGRAPFDVLAEDMDRKWRLHKAGRLPEEERI